MKKKPNTSDYIMNGVYAGPETIDNICVEARMVYAGPDVMARRFSAPENAVPNTFTSTSYPQNFAVDSLCPSCQYPAKPGSKFCVNCGSILPKSTGEKA